MPDGKDDSGKGAKQGKKPREIKDAGQRIVFAGLELPAELIVKALRESVELPPLPGAKEATQKEKEAELERVLGLIAAAVAGGPDDGTKTLTVWVRTGPVVDGSPTKVEAVQAAVDAPLGRKAPGRFRAPSLTHWRGEVRRVAPTAVPLDEEVVD